MRFLRWGIALVLVVCAGSVTVLHGAGAAMNYAAARKVSNSFFTALVGNKVDDALNLMEPGYVEKLGRPQAEERVAKLFEYCGQPLEGQITEEENGTKTNANGHTSPTRKFYYYSSTTLFQKNTCWFFVTVVPSSKGLRVTDFGAIKQFGGIL